MWTPPRRLVDVPPTVEAHLCCSVQDCLKDPAVDDHRQLLSALTLFLSTPFFFSLRLMAGVRRATEGAGHPDLHLEEDHFPGNTAGGLRLRRPQITVTSAQPVDANNRFSAPSAVFPRSPPASWSLGIQVHAKQVTKEKTRENDVAQPKAAPRRPPSANTSSPQTHPVRGKNPQKPPRPSLPRPVVREQSGPPESEENCCDQWSRSVTVHWSTPTTPTPSPPDLRPTPVPLPRIKSKRKAVTEVKTQTLVQLDEVDSEVSSGADAESSSKYLKELLEVFGEENPDLQSVEEAAMNGNHNQRNIQARIQAFESQTGPEDGHVTESTKPQPLPRKTPKSPVSSKPPVTVRWQFNHSLDQDVQNVAQEPPSPSTEFKPRLPQKPAAGKPVHADLESLLAKGGPPYGSRPLLTRDYSIHEEEEPPIPVPVLPPRSPVKSPKEALKANLNINNHNSTSIYSEIDYVESPSSSPAPGIIHRAESVSRPGVARRPTTIRVPSQTESLPANAPPLPAQKPVGSLTSASVPKQKSLPSMPLQAPFSAASPPTRAQSLRRPPPQRPPAARPGPGRPPPPKTQTQKPSRRIPMLPPRPTPGQQLYNKYTKNQVVLLLDEVNQDMFQCQVGDARGGVHKSRLQVITPLHAHFPATPSQASNVLKVQALHDFTPEGEGELALQAGDIISRVEKVDSEWYRGCLHANTGFFPVSYVQVLSEAPSERKPEVKVSGPRCVARFDFEGGSSEELTFSEGDVIHLKEYLDQEWARGQMGVHSGIFPLSFVQVLEHLPQHHQVLEHLPQQTTRIALPGMADPPQAEAVQPAQSSAEWAVALYAFHGTSPEELSFMAGDGVLVTKHINQEWSSGRHDGREGIFPTAFVERRQTGFLGEQPEGDGGVQGKAMYDFTANCDEELSMQVGDVINNLEVLDDDWFLGDLRGRRALVPRTYIQVI
ncbi:SH3 domain-containing protein 19 isoform X2 [Nerophis ophidion]|uniref:SH3 domain-containing protein 19 isoform X2 n=1 Tax=Nerophis ophidion TaxID=159077 RepID=UPI002ADF6D77|nr:SH3 domain-containing protein 19 isoform X2 [Nerophis ophidion]